MDPVRLSAMGQENMNDLGEPHPCRSPRGQRMQARVDEDLGVRQLPVPAASARCRAIAVGDRWIFAGHGARLYGQYGAVLTPKTAEHRCQGHVGSPLPVASAAVFVLVAATVWR
jgi:hypothetical protein